MSINNVAQEDFSGGAGEKVGDVFRVAQSFARVAYDRAEEFIDSLSSTVYAPPSLSVTWSGLAAPSIDALPAVPTLPTINFVVPGGTPNELSLPVPNINIDDFNEAAPALNELVAPVVNYGVAPTVPDVGAVPVPDAPELAFPDAPMQLSLSLPTFGGLNLREDWLDKLDVMPELELVAPTPYTFTQNPDYSSAVLESLKSVIQTRLAGGTGLPPAVEQALWDRARDRETKTALANIADVNRQSEALGYHLPPGVVAAQLRAAQQDYYDKLSGLSRDISIKQAELEQSNLKEVVAQGIQLEGQLIDYSWKMEQMAFESAKTYAENALQVFNAEVEQYKALLAGYQTYASVYKDIIQAELAKVEVYKVQIDAEKAKADINKSLVDAYKAEIEASMAQVEIYRAQVGAAQTLVQLEQAKIGAAGEQIRAYVAQVNAETAKVEAYKAQVQADATKVDMYRTKAQAFSAKVGAQADRARAEISRYSALYQAKASEWGSYQAKVAAESERIRALGMQSASLLDGYKAAATSVTAKAEMQTKIWETQIRQYEAGQNIVLQTAKINTDNLMTANNARLDAAKVGAQVFAQLTASAYGMMNAQAGVSGTSTSSRNNNVSYNYGAELETAPLTAIAGV
jgi:hypothetical protein